MTSNFPNDNNLFFNGANTNTNTPQTRPNPYFQQQQQGNVFSSMEQIFQKRRTDLLIGKRSFNDFQQQLFQQQQHQQQFQNNLLILQQQQQSYLMRSVKPRTFDISNSLSSPSNTRFGVPIYRQQLFNNINNNNNINHFIPTNNNNCSITNNLPSSTNNNLINPVQTQNLGFGCSNIGPNLAQQKPEIQPVFSNSNSLEDRKILNTLHELEKQLLDDDDDEDHNNNNNNEDENDAVSVITNSEWSETFQNLINSNSSPNPSPNPNVISPSPTSSTSSCCSTSAPPPQQLPQEALTVKKLVFEAANAISEGKIELGSEYLTRLDRVSNPKGNSEQRLGFYLGNAIRGRCTGTPCENFTPVQELYSDDQMKAMNLLNDISPCFKFGLLAANLVMLEAITIALQGGVKVHIIDFNVGQGAQYVNLIRALADRRRAGGGSGGGGGCEVKITVVETEVDNCVLMESVRNVLVKVGEEVGIKVRFEGLTRKITELTRESLGCEDNEAIVVNFAFKLHRIGDESVSIENLRDELLRRVKEIKPRAVTLVEQELNGNTAPFLTRVNEACGYYGALFDSLESTLPRDHVDRARVEAGLGRKMVNVIACEGRERVERAEVFGKWRARMGMAGFELKPLSQTVAESMRAKLNSGRNGNPGFTVKEESGGVGLGWMGRTLTVASAWR